MPTVKIVVNAGNLERELGKRIQKGIDQSLPRAVAEVASDIRAGESGWPEDTKLSRNHFRPTQTRIANDVPYVRYVHKGEALRLLIVWIDTEIARIYKRWLRKKL